LSSDSREQIIGEVVEALRMHQNAVDAVDDAAGEYLGINRTDMRCLDIIERRGGVSAGELAAESGLTTGAITAALDRLEGAGYVRRIRDVVDRRRVLVELTDKAQRCSWECYGPIAQEGHKELDHLSIEQLTVIRDFMRAGYELLNRHAARMRELAPRQAKGKHAAR
jgi:DNA-binding MarR family transcriptional regulator